MNKTVKTLAIWMASSSSVTLNVEAYTPKVRSTPTEDVRSRYFNAKGKYSSYKSEDRSNEIRQQLLNDINRLRTQIREMSKVGKPLGIHYGRTCMSSSLLINKIVN